MASSNKKIDYDVAVVGGGPAGASAALDLGRAGVSVVLIEKYSLPRYKTCGGGVLRRAMRLLPAETVGAVERTCHAVEISLNRPGLKFSMTRSEPIVYMTMRATLDHCLSTAAEQSGACLLTGCPVVDIATDRHAVTICTATQTVRTRFVVAADGANSHVARCLDWTDGRRLIPAVECEVSVDEGSLARMSRSVRFDFGVVPHGYAWVFPKRPHLSIGALSMNRGRLNLWNELAKYMALLDIRDVHHVERHGALIPVTPRNGPLASERVMLTGDAAGLADPLTAEGITFAIRSGQLAAASILECLANGSNAGEIYRAEIRQSLLPELKASRVLANLVYQYPRLRDFVFRVHGHKFAELMTDIIVGDLTCCACLYKPINYLKLAGLVKTTLNADGRVSANA